MTQVVKFKKMTSGYYAFRDWEIINLDGAWQVTKGGSVHPSQFTWASTLKEAKEYIITREDTK